MDAATPGQQSGYQPPPPMPGGTIVAKDAVAGPAIGMIVFAILGILIQIVAIGIRLVGIGFMRTFQQDNEAWTWITGGLGLMLGLLSMAVAVVVIAGAVKMMKLESYPLAMTAAILSMIPCLSPCCLMAIPIGICSLVVLLNPNVKAAFR